MTSAEEIAAALERWNAARRGTVTDRARESGDEMALLLRAELDAEPEPEFIRVGGRGMDTVHPQPAPAASPSREWLEKMAALEVEGEVSVGGLACDVGFPVQPPAASGEADEALLREADGCCPLDTEPKLLITRLAARLRELKADVARLTRELFKAQDGIADIIRRTEDDTQERIRAAAEAAVKEAQRDDVLFTAFVFGFLRRDLEKRSCLPPPEWYSEDSMIAMILEAIRARAEKE